MQTRLETIGNEQREMIAVLVVVDNFHRTFHYNSSFGEQPADEKENDWMMKVVLFCM